MSRMSDITGIGLLTTMGAMFFTGCEIDRKPTSSDDAAEIRLPPPRTDSGMSLARALATRRSQREFLDESPSAELISALTWAAQGITDRDQGLRTAPSAGALYPITLLLVDGAGVYEYEPQRHALRRVLDGDRRKELQAAALDQSSVGTAPLCIVIAADVARTASKYGSQAERYCLLEAGHIAQNILLQATAHGAAGVPVGAFEDAKVSAALRLPERLRPLYLLPIGYPTDR